MWPTADTTLSVKDATSYGWTSFDSMWRVKSMKICPSCDGSNMSEMTNPRTDEITRVSCWTCNGLGEVVDTVQAGEMAKDWLKWPWPASMDERKKPR